MKSLLAALSLSSLLFSAPALSQKSDGNLVNETPQQFAKRTKWWNEAKFGMFIHWGLYAVPADATNKNGQKVLAEWYLSNKQAQVADYAKFATQFNPVKFDAKKIVAAAKYAGMKYIVITSKHHDGFAMFDSKVSDYDIVDATPYKRDLMKSLANECKKQGVRLCFYHSIMDWHHPDYLPRRDWEKETRPIAGADYSRYTTYMKEQLKELVTQYNPGVMWFDGEWEATWNHEMGKDLYSYVRGLKPDIIVNNRVDKGRQGMQGMTATGTFVGDFGTPEQEIPTTGFTDGRLWETCMTMNDTWGYARNDNNWKPSETLIRNLIDVASKGGNYLLNVGPTELGELTPETYERLNALGNWMQKNSAAIYGTQSSPFAGLKFDGRCTRKGNTLYLHVFNFPGSELTLTGLQAKVKSVRVLGGEKLTFEQNTGELRISKPSTLDPVATVIEVKQ